MSPFVRHLIGTERPADLDAAVNKRDSLEPYGKWLFRIGRLPSCVGADSC
jgi:hypothetical protein